MKLLIEALKELFRKRLTKKYPFEKITAQPRFRGLQVHKKKACIYCGLCAQNCPAFAIIVQRDRKIWQVDWGRCIFCGRCQEVCPKKAIRFTTRCEKVAEEKKGLLYVD